VNKISVSSGVAMTSALQYAQRGLFVFPIYEPAAGLNGCSCRKGQDCTGVGKHPRTHTGFNAASRNEEQITKWWTKYPNANIGVATGKDSNVVVVDIDDRNGGSDTLDALLLEVGEPFPITLTAITGNGIHYYFLAPEQPIKSQSGALGSGIDIKAEGGYVVAPPSLHPSGRNYEFIDPDAGIAELPVWILNLLHREDKASESTRESVIPEGTRNNTLTSIAGQLRYRGAERAEIQAELRAINAEQCDPPLAEDEVDAIAKSIAARSAGAVPRPGHRSPLHWFRFDVGWWNSNVNVSQMDARQKGWYIDLMVKAFPMGGRLPADTRALAKLAHASSVAIFERHCGLVLAEFERHADADGEYLIHPLLSDNYAEARVSVDQKITAGKASAVARKNRQNLGVSA
jgi:hypothetical protein